MTPKIAIILFPGTNCELEAIRALKRSGMDTQLVRWNEEVDYTKFDGFFLPGGFSYEDRGRSGIIASKNKLLRKIKLEATNGKPIIGICNGAQILLEAKLIPNLDPTNVEMALAENKRQDENGNIIGTGFYNDWIYIKSPATKGRSAFNNFKNDHIMKVPIAHAEGRFTTIDKELLDVLETNEQSLFKYCDQNGEIINKFPINPNGALLNLAGVCNPEGNVLSLMPHPERTENGQAIFDSMYDYISKTYTLILPDKIIKKRDSKVDNKIKESISYDVEIYIDTVITDNEERTIEQAIHNMGFEKAQLQKQSFFGIQAGNGNDLIKIAEELIASGEIVNLAKEVPTIIIGDEAYSYDVIDGLTEINITHKGISYITIDKENTLGKDIFQKLTHHFQIDGIREIVYGKKWSLNNTDEEKSLEIVKTQIFHNPSAMDIFKI